MKTEDINSKMFPKKLDTNTVVYCERTKIKVKKLKKMDFKAYVQNLKPSSRRSYFAAAENFEKWYNAEKKPAITCELIVRYSETLKQLAATTVFSQIGIVLKKIQMDYKTNIKWTDLPHLEQSLKNAAKKHKVKKSLTIPYEKLEEFWKKETNGAIELDQIFVREQNLMQPLKRMQK